MRGKGGSVRTEKERENREREERPKQREREFNAKSHIIEERVVNI